MEDNCPIVLTDEHKQTLLGVARASLEHGLVHHRAQSVNLKDYAPELQVLWAAFVTLTLEDQLRGCVGTLEASQPLVVNVAKYAYSAGFSDPRFPELTWEELPHVKIEISILSGLEPLQFDSETDLVEQLRPGIDGLVLEDGPYRGTLLPSVWEKATEKRQFLQQLKRKAGLPRDYWSDRVQIKRYTTTCIE